MRNYWFRAKRSDDNEWVYGSLMITPVARSKTIQFFIIEQSEEALMHPIIPETTSIFTGLYDGKRTKEYPNGQPIFVGDYFKYENDKGETYGRIFFDKGRFWCGDYSDQVTLSQHDQIEIVAKDEEEFDDYCYNVIFNMNDDPDLSETEETT